MDRAGRHDLTAVRLEFDAGILLQGPADAEVGRLAEVDVEAAAARDHGRALGQAEVGEQPGERIVAFGEVAGITLPAGSLE